jgi:hypothetical protein
VAAQFVTSRVVLSSTDLATNKYDKFGYEILPHGVTSKKMAFFTHNVLAAPQ